MKKIILVLVVFLLTLTGCGKERIEDMSKLELRDGIIYVIGENKPYTGTFVKKFENGDIQEIINFKNGKVHGKHEVYYKNRQLASIRFPKNGKNDGEYKTYYENGYLSTEATYINGKKDGTTRIYYENGQLWRELKYKNGVQVVPTKWYDENGNQKASL